MIIQVISPNCSRLLLTDDIKGIRMIIQELLIQLLPRLLGTVARKESSAHLIDLLHE